MKEFKVSKVFPNLNRSGGIDPRIITRGGIVGADAKDKPALTREDLIQKAIALHAEEKEVSKVARAIRKNERKSKSTKNPNHNIRVIDADFEARNEGPQVRKSFHVHDLKDIQPKTDHQKETFLAWGSDKHLLLSGTAGTGKSFIAIYLALCDVLDPDFEQNKLVVVRSAVPSRDQGFLPGSEEEKSAVYELPYINIFDELFPYKKSYENMKKAGIVQFMTTSYLRGITINDAVVIVDECENMTFQEISTVITRMGRNTRVIFCGDIHQNDLIYKKNDQSGMIDFQRLVNAHMPSIQIVRFDWKDIVRSGLVKEFIIACEKEKIYQD